MQNNWITYIKQLDQIGVLPAKDAVNNANLVLKNQFIFNHPYDMEPTTTIVNFDPIKWQQSPNGDPEWLYMLKRQEYLTDLLHAFYITEKQDYLLKAKQLILEWIDQNLTLPETWRTIDTGIRLLNWAPVVKVLKEQSVLTKVEQRKIKDAVQKQVYYLKQNYIEKYDISNWGVLITTGILVYDAINNQTISNSDTEWALERLECEIALQVNPDGTHWEQSPLYFLEVWKSTLSVYAAYKQNNIAFPKQLLTSLQAMHNCAPHLIKPNHLLLQQGDTDSINIDSLYQSSGVLLDLQPVADMKITSVVDFILVELYHHQGIKTFLKKQAPTSTPIANLAFDSPITGNYYWRSNWSNVADYWHIYNGTLGSGHGHAALGHIDLALNGHDILIDPGRFTYVDGTERRYLKSVGAHNTIEIDDHPFTKPADSWKFSEVGLPLNNTVSHQKDIDLTSITYLEHPDDSQSPIVTRHFIWLRAFKIMVVLDAIKAPGKHTIKMRYNLAPNLTVSQSQEQPIKLADGTFNVQLFSSVQKHFLKRSLFSLRYNQLTHLNQLEFCQNIKDYAVQYTVLAEHNNLKQVKTVKVTQSGEPNKIVQPEKCSAFEIVLNQNDSLLITLQWLNTFIGRKLYLVNGHPAYGTLNIIYLHNGKETHRSHLI
ncbi:alginate lyase family protein [Loigolactobacillus coryniformis subsp. torquens]|nr:alginate lyase family protein [Loigolactobacillus coryniformis subsp. torquens]MBW4806449.1 alginate lyase family protein [Loigolactobacillus coryniformis subsp. torquens]